MDRTTASDVVSVPHPSQKAKDGAPALLLGSEDTAPIDSSTAHQSDRLLSLKVRLDDSDNSRVDAILEAHSRLDRA